MSWDESGRYDVVVVGSGIAGLYAALLAAPHGKVLLVTKGSLEESNTRYAQGGIAAALASQDSPELHLRDTIAAGDGLGDPHPLGILTREAPNCIRELMRLGVPFDREGGKLAFTLEAAHSLPRVLHAGGDATGASIEKTLARAVRAAGVTVQEDALCTELLMREGTVCGTTVLLGDGTVADVAASQVILASGGAGQLYTRTTNPAVATGDGLAIAYRAGAELMDLEFMQFHPTALVVPGAPSFLISEAVRGEGGILRDVHGHAFMADYHADRELAPRDVVARAIHQQMLRTESGHVWLDVTHLPAERVERRFPSILAFCRRHGIDPLREPIPVAPAAHYLMGGVRTDSWGRTSLPGLFACGEVACTGVHGANRLASNSLLEGLVFARRSVQCILEGKPDEEMAPVMSQTLGTPAAVDVTPGAFDLRLKEMLAAVMWREVSLVRSEGSLLEARSFIERFTLTSRPQQTIPARGSLIQRWNPCPESFLPCAGEGENAPLSHSMGEGLGARVSPSRPEHELANLVLLSSLLVESALLRKESRGAHFRSDFSRRDPAWRGHIVVSREGASFTPLDLDVPSHVLQASYD